MRRESAAVDLELPVVAGGDACGDSRAGGGHMEVLEWATANGCPRDDEACENAAAYGSIACGRTFRMHGRAGGGSGTAVGPLTATRMPAPTAPTHSPTHSPTSPSQRSLRRGNSSGL
eukprot:CAMPEP_0119144232 /NCGR_PEP_ID=MMETSP1310-20130426/35571_1 /TAXON_ID=464262 /ORGANISM="Genus nov. species nov., Strain RCC2339" /LENGTH=116 /DNA_ID=CAMNT_0007135957 /DNA_START=30 /DNA_END=379 /DNA_ORIENTATION=+